MNRIIDINSVEDILPVYRNTPISLLLEYHNLGREFGTYSQAELLVGMCMDNRKKLNIPHNFTYIIRSGGGNLRHSEFKVSYAIAVGKVKYIAVIAHNNCGMVNLHLREDLFINGLVERAGWDRAMAIKHFRYFAPKFEIENEIDFVLAEAKRLRECYPKIMVAPLFYNVDTNKICLIHED